MSFFEKIFALRHKKIKFLYYLKGAFRYYFIPDFLFRLFIQKHIEALKERPDAVYIQKRVNYYNKLKFKVPVGPDAIEIKNFRFKEHKTTYFIDTQKHIRYFNPDFRFNPLFGDITYVPEFPSFVKSRPIVTDNFNSVLLKLNKIRHFIFVKDREEFRKKKNMLVWRGNITDFKEQRIRFFKKYYNHPLCDIGYTNNWGKNLHWAKKRMSIDEQLKYKFVLCLEGMDVATNLKWVMSSNSLALMPYPRFETWFMEGTLIPDFHYVLVKDDFSDLEEKIKYYINYPDEAEKILANAHDFVEQFKNPKREKIISLLVMKKYFCQTDQC
ncbi:MAG: hypothetical protein PWQ17_1102 [Anaerophaga sp.]|nr:hypothetical protein [Anaerophaga sp.]